MNTPILTTLQEENAPWNKVDKLKETTVEVTVYLTKTIKITTKTDSRQEMLDKVGDAINDTDFNKWDIDNVDVVDVTKI